MKKLHTTFSALLLTAAVLLSGCAGKENDSAPGSGSNSVSDVSDNSEAQSITSDNSTDSLNSSENSREISDSASGSEQSSDSGVETIPVEFTDEDRELQKILSDLYDPAEEIFQMMNGIRTVLVREEFEFKFKFPQDIHPDNARTYYLIPENTFSSEDARFALPTSIAEMEELMLQYYSVERTKSTLSRLFCVCEAIENLDGTYTLTYEKKVENQYPLFVEIDGKLYMNDGGGSGAGIDIDCETAKIISKTDNAIEFTYLSNYWITREENLKKLNDIELYSENATNGMLKYEDGSWKLDDFAGVIFM